MKTRGDAVEYFKNRGIHAVERDWALGETVFVAVGGEEVGGITAYKRAMYIVSKAGAWTSFELDRPRPDDDAELSLAEACARVERILTMPSDHPRDKRR